MAGSNSEVRTVSGSTLMKRDVQSKSFHNSPPRSHLEDTILNIRGSKKNLTIVSRDEPFLEPDPKNSLSILTNRANMEFTQALEKYDAV